jgi:hypothetical protein
VATTSSTSIRASASATTALRRLAYQLSAELGRRVPLGEALEAAVTVAARNIPATIGALPTREDTP